MESQNPLTSSNKTKLLAAGIVIIVLAATGGILIAWKTGLFSDQVIVNNISDPTTLKGIMAYCDATTSYPEMAHDRFYWENRAALANVLKFHFELKISAPLSWKKSNCYFLIPKTSCLT